MLVSISPNPSRLSSVVAWRGASLIDGAPIMVVLTGIARPSKNAKTGAMVQAWIIRSDVSPVDAVKRGLDASICGSCPHRRGADDVRTCYVTVHNAPRAAFAGVASGGTPDVTPDVAAGMLSGRKVRLGAYGDPAAVPASVWRTLLRHAAGWTGYTHQWRTAEPALRDLCMASVDSAAEHWQAVAAGWRTFRVMADDETTRHDEIVCPAYTRGLTCERCGLCSGAGGRPGARSIAIAAHGASARLVDRPRFE